jgi:hypothetical protein
MALRFKSGLLGLAFVSLGCTSFCLGQTPQHTPVPSPEPGGIAPATEPLPGPRLPGSISGTVVDPSGAVVAGARVSLTADDHSLNRDVLSGVDGQFSFGNIAPGPFQLTISATGFAMQTFSGVLHSGEIDTLPQIRLNVAAAVTEVVVGLSRAEQVEVAEQEIKDEEKQRVLAVIPNFYVSYIPDPVPLTPKQKFEIAWKTVVDPVTFAVVGATAGVEQAQNHFSGYGQGAQGYGKRYGAGYTDTVVSTFIGSAILPSLLRQDPRYFYKGSGTMGSRIMYAIANSVICKGDNRRWQANYSGILGGLAAGGVSNLYYPANDRDGLGLTFENAGIGIGGTAVANLFQEFVVRKLTPKVPSHDPAVP